MKFLVVFNTRNIEGEKQYLITVTQPIYISTGSIGDKFYIILKGSVSVQIPIKRKKEKQAVESEKK